MSIQQWSPTVRDDDGPDMYMDDNGSYVYYDDHVAEMKRALDDDVLAAAHHGQKGYEVGYTSAVEAMRAACIAAVEEVLSRTRNAAHEEYLLVSKHHPADLLAALKEVQP